jgi:5-methyltetrahydropteroyltriglutamate--homocysteine methyltransferase
MVDVFCSVLGGYPRNRRVRHLVRDFEEGRISSVEYNNVLGGETIFLAGVQRGLGCKYIVDGMLEWHDIFRPFVESWRGVYPSGLLRYFDNNFFYRIPVFHDAPEPFKTVVSPKYQLVKEYLGPALYKAVIPGPVSFLSLSKNETGKDDVWLATKIAEALNREITALGEEGIVVQVDEPALTDNELYSRVKGSITDIYSALLEKVSVPVHVSIYFGCMVEKAYEELLNVKGLEMINLDVVDCKRASEVIREYGIIGKKLGLGVIEARDIYQDSFDKVRGLVNSFIENTGVESIHLTTSTWLDLIPFEYALEKTRLLSDYASRIKEVA